MEKPIVISLGGSLLVPDEINYEFIESFISLIKKHAEEDKRFVIIAGGGKTARRYMGAGEKLGFSGEEMDWIGIHSTRLNAELLKISFKDLAHDELVIDPSEIKNWVKPVLIGAGWKPGWSTDYDAVEVAKQFGAGQIVNLSNIEYVYDKDPNEFSDAKKIEEIKWSEYIKLIPEEWSSGLNTPFDPLASREAMKENISVAILSGNLDNLEAYLNGKLFTGTLIS